MANLNADISDRLTPSVPIEITFGSQATALGRKVTTIFGHKAASGDTAPDYFAYMVVNVGDPAAAKAEVDALAGAGSQIGLMVAAFINANVLAGRSNFPAIRIVLIPHSVTTFGSGGEAINAVKFLRSDMFVSCYPAGDGTNWATLLALVTLISGIDRDLNGQFGSYMTVGSLDALATADTYAYNSRFAIIAYLQDTNTASVTQNGDVTISSNVVTNIASTAGIYPGATITGTAVPTGALVGVVSKTSLTMVDATGAAVNATATHAAESIVYQNVVSQAPEIVAAAHAGAMVSFQQPYIPLQNVVVGGLIAPRKSSDWIIVDPNGASEAALVGGLSPLKVTANQQIAFIRTRTTFVLLSDDVTPATTYIDWQDLVILNDFREDCYLISQNPPFNNNPGGTKLTIQISANFKDEVLRKATDYENAGMFQGVQTLAPLFIVQPSSSSRGRLDFKIPVNVVPGLLVIAGNIQAVSGIGDFTL